MDASIPSVGHSFDFDVSGRESRDLVLLKCREVIEQLHQEVEEEREKRRKLEKKQHQWEADNLNVTTELDILRQKRADSEAEVARLTATVSDLERQLQELERAKEQQATVAHQLQREVVAKTSELSSKDLQLQEQHHLVQRLESKLQTATLEAKQLTEEVTTLSQKLGESESERTRLKITLETSADARAREARRVADEKDLALARVQRQADDAAREVRTLQDELRSRVEECTQLELGQRAREREQREREDLEVKLENARAELNLVQRKAHDLEKKQEQASIQFGAAQAEVTSLRGQLDHAQREYDDVQKQLAVRTTELTHFRSQCEVLQEAARGHSEERTAVQERWLAATAEANELRHQVEEARAELRSKADASRGKDEEQRRLDETVRQLKDEAAQDRGQKLEQQLQHEQRVHELAAECRQYQETVREMNTQVDRLQKELQQVQVELAAANEGRRQSERHVVAMEAEVGGMNNALRVAEQAAADSREREREARQAAERAKEDAHAQALRAARPEVKVVYDRGKLERLRDKYEMKIAKLHRQLVEREQHETRLRGVLEGELRGVANWHNDLERREVASRLFRGNEDNQMWRDFFASQLGEIKSEFQSHERRLRRMFDSEKIKSAS